MNIKILPDSLYYLPFWDKSDLNLLEVHILFQKINNRKII